MKLFLRDVLPSDLPIFFENQLDDEANYMAAFTSKDPKDRKAFDAQWEKMLKLDTVLIKTVVLDGKVTGSVLSYVEDEKTEVSYWFGREFWGKGIATAALKLFLDIQKIRPIYARVATDNPGSIRVLEKCKFSVIGTDLGFANARGKEIKEYTMILN